MMKNTLILGTFILTVLFGLIADNDFPFKLDNYLHANCHRWANETFDKSFFTLQEAEQLLRKKVVSKKTDFRNNKIGRIVSSEMVAADKFLIEIYWGNGANDENSTVTVHDKEGFLRDFEVID